MLTTLLVVLALQKQQPPRQPDLALVAGAVEAPRQPIGSSDSTVLRGPRFEVTPGVGTNRAVTVRIGDLVAVRGQEENQVQGIGLVTGLSGTGDSTIAARQAILNLLKTQNIVLDLQSVSSSNAAVVLVGSPHAGASVAAARTASAYRAR